jgi:SAM-dependent methyltransferase
VAQDAYLLPNRAAGAPRRLELLAELYDAWTFRHLEACGIGPGMRCWEVGAGGPTVPRWLAARVGESGRVLATDIDTSALTGLPPTVDVRRHDVARDAPPVDAFDLVHARLVLVHLPERERALAAMIAAVRPGGWIVIEDADPGMQPLACLQEGATADRAQRIRRGFRRLVEARGADLAWGRRLPGLLRDAGLRRVGGDAYLALALPACAALEAMTVQMLRDALIAAGHATADELDAHLASVLAGELDMAQPALVSAWGQQPPP